MMEVNGHSIVEETVSIDPFGSMTQYTCEDENCEIMVTGADDEELKHIAKSGKCPQSPNTCTLCGEMIYPDGNVCHGCMSDMRVTEKVK